MKYKVRHGIEAIVNVGTGMMLAYGISIVYFHFTPTPNPMDTLQLTALLTGVSVVRSFLWRRFFHNTWLKKDG